MDVTPLCRASFRTGGRRSRARRGRRMHKRQRGRHARRGALAQARLRRPAAGDPATGEFGGAKLIGSSATHPKI
jgi:hypothetical protein